VAVGVRSGVELWAFPLLGHARHFCGLAAHHALASQPCRPYELMPAPCHALDGRVGEAGQGIRSTIWLSSSVVGAAMVSWSLAASNKGMKQTRGRWKWGAASSSVRSAVRLSSTSALVDRAPRSLSPVLDGPVAGPRNGRVGPASLRTNSRCLSSAAFTGSVQQPRTGAAVAPSASLPLVAWAADRLALQRGASSLRHLRRHC
jgi:hypothetical protein